MESRRVTIYFDGVWDIVVPNIIKEHFAVKDYCSEQLGMVLSDMDVDIDEIIDPLEEESNE